MNFGSVRMTSTFGSGGDERCAEYGRDQRDGPEKAPNHRDPRRAHAVRFAQVTAERSGPVPHSTQTTASDAVERRIGTAGLSGSGRSAGCRTPASAR
jgi:hypothetical protein